MDWRYWRVVCAASTASDAVMAIAVRALFMGGSWVGIGDWFLGIVALAAGRRRTGVLMATADARSAGRFLGNCVAGSTRQARRRGAVLRAFSNTKAACGMRPVGRRRTAPAGGQNSRGRSSPEAAINAIWVYAADLGCDVQLTYDISSPA